MPKPLTFSDPELNRAVLKSAGRFENFKTALEETSADIKKLEEWLQQCGVCIPTFVQISDYNSIGWDKLGSSWRLVFEGAEGDGPETRPLADTPIKTRFAARRYLGDLVEEIGKLLPDANSGGNSGGKPVAQELESIFADADKIPF